jgi:hypothetical protein
VLPLDGYLVVYDPMLRDGESRQDFLARSRQLMQTQWTALSRLEAKMMEAHVTGYDFPESVESLNHWATRHGLQPAEVLFRDPSGIYQMLSFQRKS